MRGQKALKDAIQFEKNHVAKNDWNEQMQYDDMLFPYCVRCIRGWGTLYQDWKPERSYAVKEWELDENKFVKEKMKSGGGNVSAFGGQGNTGGAFGASTGGFGQTNQNANQNSGGFGGNNNSFGNNNTNQNTNAFAG